MKQRTIGSAVTVDGIGLQTGAKVMVKLCPAPVNTGIRFIRTDLADRPEIDIRKAVQEGAAQAERRTVLGSGPLQVQTTEHFLAALAGYSIDNLFVEIDNVELPGLDGSAADFLRLIKKAKISEQDADKAVHKVMAPVWCADGGSFLAVFPDDHFRISYTLSYASQAIGTQFFSIVVDEKSFETEIAPARTFCLEEEALELIKRGLGRGATHENTLVIGKNGPIKNFFRFPDELVRHKVLDLIGDLFLLGAPLLGHVVAIKSGHKLNMELVKKLKSQ